MTESNQSLMSDDDGIDIFYYLGFLYKHKKFILIFCSIVCFLATVIIIRIPNQYTAKAKILSSGNASSAGMTRMRAIAAQFGVSTGSVQDNISSPQVYVEVLKSRDVLERVACMKFKTEDDTSLRTIPEIYDFKQEMFDEINQEQMLTEMLLAAISTNISLESQIITIGCRMRDKQLAVEIVEALIRELKRFDNEVRTSKAKDNVIFLEMRLEETKANLVLAEEVLSSFKENNRKIFGSAQLELQLGRLMREVKVQEEIYLTLTTEHELAKVQEVKEQPVFDIIEHPRKPLYKTGMRKFKLLFIVGFLSFLVSCGIVFIREYLKENDIMGKIKEQSRNI